MPLVKVKYRNSAHERVADLLGRQLRRIVAAALTCENPEGHLTAKDIDVEPLEMSPGLQTDYGFIIEVEANEYPERRKNLDERWEDIAVDLRQFFDHPGFGLETRPKAALWVKLFPAKWGDV